MLRSVLLANTTIVAAIFVLCSCSSPSAGVISEAAATPGKLPVIVVDEEHFQVARGDGSEPAIYTMSAGEAFVLDATGYQFSVTTGLDSREPNAIQVIVQEGAVFTMDWLPGVQRYTISAAALEPAGEAGTFTGFAAGQQVTVAIGYLEDPGRGQGAQFYVFWVGSIAVR